MSCQIKGIAYLTDPDELKTALLKDTSVKFDHVPKEELPLQDCLISLSSAGDVLAVALHKNITILVSKWDSRESGEVKNKFQIVWSGCLTSEPNEYITSVICLPLAALGKANAGGGLDWTCIAVGFSTGFVRFYTETGGLLLQVQLHNESVLCIKCQSLTPPKHSGETGLSEEIHVLYTSVVCVLGGFSLFSSLRSSRNCLARVQANCTAGEKFSPTNTSGLVLKKLGFKEQDIINDCELIGMTSVNTFDHLMTATICGGYNASYRSSAPQHNLIIATGKRPYIGFHFALEGGAAPVLTDVAIAMASSLASAIGKIGATVPWLRSNLKGSSQSQNQSNSSNNNHNNNNNDGKNSAGQEKGKGPVSEPPEAMTCRFGLSDVMREGDSLVISPNRALSVITDRMGRVIMVNNKKGIALRMWKGYRDAQCGWIEATEERNLSTHRNQRGHNSTTKMSSSGATLRSAIFLVIYAPKKGVIDIWSVQQGGKITTFSASKSGRLIYINYGLLGLNDITPTIPNKPQYTCVFMDPLGGLKEISVPFHFALSSKNGKRARDIHLLKKLKTFIREEEFDEDKLIKQILSICTEMKTNEIRLQIMEMLMNNRHITPDALLTAVNCFINVLIQFEDDELEPAGKTLYYIVIQLQKVIEFYKYVRHQFDCPPEYNTVASVNNIPDVKALAKILHTSPCEVERILKLSKDLYKFETNNVKQSKVTFKDDDGLFLTYVSSFEFGVPQNNIRLVSQLDADKKYQIASLVYQGWMYSSDTTGEWEEVAQASNISPQSLMELALIYWLKKLPGAPLEIELTRFTELLRSISTLNHRTDCDPLGSDYSDSEISSLWWKNVRSVLMTSVRPFQALTAALACRAVEVTLQKIKDEGLNDPRDVSENISEKQKKNSSGSKSEIHVEEKSLTEWENISKDTCQLSLLIGNLEDVSILNAVVNQPPPSDDTTSSFSLPFEKLDISMAYIINKGKGAVSEIVSKWLSSSGINPECLIDTTDIEFHHHDEDHGKFGKNKSFDNASSEDQVAQDKGRVPSEEDAVSLNKSKEEKSKVTGTADTTSELSIISNSEEVQTAQGEILQKIALLKRHFPYSLMSSILLANLSWEFVMFWSKDLTRLDALAAALNVIKIIPMKSMKHGVCCLLWTIHLKKKMETIAKLMNKLGKLPKERLCIQEIGLSDVQLITLLQHCVKFLDIFLDSEVIETDNESNLVLISEELWEGQSTGPQPFASLAINQTPAWYDLVMLHLQLANVLHMMAYFNLKIVKPMSNLFESVTSRYFFQDITDKTVLSWYRDDRRDILREEFLCRVITASVESINQETTVAESSNQFHSNQAISWISKCHVLASVWKINNDKLRIHQVCQLYINGFDRLAEEVSTAINDTETLAINLLPVAGKRMMAYLSQAPNLLEEVSRISPALTQYLEDINMPGVIMATSSNDDTIQLIHKVARYLPETYKHHHVAQLMLDATFIYEGKT